MISAKCCVWAGFRQRPEWLLWLFWGDGGHAQEGDSGVKGVTAYGCGRDRGEAIQDSGFKLREGLLRCGEPRGLW